MNKQFMILMIAVFTLIVWKSAVADRHFLHTGSLIESVDSGDSFECESVTTKEDMINTLNQAGWKTPTYPDIDWNKDEAIIVAPDIYYKNANMVFYGLFQEDKKILLSYGWQRWEDLEVEIQPDGTAVYTQFSRSPSTPSILIVSFPKKLGKNIIYCSRRRLN